MAVQFKYTPPKINAALALKAAAPAAVKAAADDLLQASQALIPVDTGALKASGRVVAEGNEAAVTYGADDAAGRAGRDTNEYVIYVHELMDRHHPTGQAKFLEEPMHTEAEKIGKALAAGIAAVFR